MSQQTSATSERSMLIESSLIPAFLWKTYNIISDEQNKDIIAWNADGDSFMIKRVNEFCDQILPKYFKHGNYSSFVRQLNMYNFHKSKKPLDIHSFSHPLFIRGRVSLLKKIKRKVPDPQKDEGSNDGQKEYTSRYHSSKKLIKLVFDLQMKHADLEMRIKELDKVNKDYCNKLSTVLNEYLRTKEKEQNLEKLMLWIFSYLSPQGNQALLGTEIPSSIVPKNNVCNEMQMWVKKVITDSIKAQNIVPCTDDSSIMSLLSMANTQMQPHVDNKLQKPKGEEEPEKKRKMTISIKIDNNELEINKIGRSIPNEEGYKDSNKIMISANKTEDSRSINPKPL